MKKKCMTFLPLLILLLLCSMPVMAFDDDSWGEAFHSLNSDGYTYDCYRYGSNMCVIYGVDMGQMRTWNVPSTLPSYEGDKTVIGVVAPKNDNPFYYVNCEGVEKVQSVTFPNTIQVIGKGAFSSCENLTEVHFPERSSMEIQDGAFADCIKLKTITFPAGSDVFERAVEGCFALETIYNAPGGLSMGEVDLDEGAVYPKLREVYIMSGETEVSGFSGYVMSGGSSTDACGVPYLSKVVLPEGVETITMGAFENCTALTSINFPKSLKEIEDSAFAGCTNLRVSVNHPGNLTYQYVNSGIENITITFDPNADYRTLFPSGFIGCKNLKSINIVNGGTGFKSVDGVLYTSAYEGGKQVGWCLAKYPAGKSNGGSYTIPSDAYLVGGFAFDSCNFSEIHIPVTVRELLSDYAASYYGDFRETRPFDNMAVKPTVYYVPHSYVDNSYSLEDCQVDLKTENGPAVKITYNLDGGKNNASNPSSMAGGTSVTLKNPTKSGYTFLGWKTNLSYSYLKNNVMTPYDQQLIDGVTCTAFWQKSGSTGKGDSSSSGSSGGNSGNGSNSGNNGSTAKGKATIKASKTSFKHGKKTVIKITSNAGTKLTVKAKNAKAKNKKFVTMKSGKTAKLTFTKKAAKGKYTFTVLSPASGNYQKTSKTITIKVK